MKKLLLLFVFVLLFMQVIPASAHPADLYIHSLYITITKDELSMEWQIKPGPMLVSSLWFEADRDMDDSVSMDEAANWAARRVALLTATLDGRQFPLKLEDVEFPNSRDSFQSGAETITIMLTAPWPHDLGHSYVLELHNAVEEQKSVSWYYIAALDEIKFLPPRQRNNIIALEIFTPPAQASAPSPLMTDWDTSMPSIPRQAAATPESNTSTFSNYIPNGENTSQDILLDFVRQKDISISFYVFALGISLLLGAMHALTPGHGKTVVAAYLVGSRGTAWHAVALGTVVTLTHTGSVLLLGVITLAASQYILPTSIIPVLEILSGLLILGLGAYLLRLRFQQWNQAKKSARTANRRKLSLQPISQPTKTPVRNFKIENRSGHPHDHHGHMHVLSGAEGHDHGDGHVHSHEVPETITWRSLIALGISGGLVPCPDAIAILLVALAINRLVLGLALIVSFSLGLAVVLIVIGLLMVNSRRLFDRMTAFDRLAPALPMASAIVVVGLGLVLTSSAFVRAKSEFKWTGAGTGSMREAQILYLAGGQEQFKQLFVANANGANPVLLSDLADNVVEYAVAPDQTKAVYIAQTEDLENRIWLVDIKNGTRGKLFECNNAICSRPVWSPDSGRIVYEYTRLSGDNLTGLATLWWVDMVTGETMPVFQEENLPGSNPRWSPDGKWLSFVTAQDVRLYNVETGENHIVNTTLAAAADWSPDGSAVLYRDVVIQNGQFVTQLFVYDLASQTSTNITLNTGYENLAAVWSPDSSRIAAIRRDLSVPQGDQVWLMRADGGEAYMLTDEPDNLHNNLRWSPDGKYLLYDVYRPISTSLESDIQVIEVESGKIIDLGIKGYNASWIWR